MGSTATNKVNPTVSVSDPRLQRLYAYWLGKKGERAAPSRADIAPEDFHDILPWVCLIEVVGERLRFRLVGDAVAEEYGGRLMGMYMDEVDLDWVTAQIMAEFHDSARRIVPVASKWRFTKISGRRLEYEQVMLPLSADGKTVNMFLCGVVGHGVG